MVSTVSSLQPLDSAIPQSAPLSYGALRRYALLVRAVYVNADVRNLWTRRTKVTAGCGFRPPRAAKNEMPAKNAESPIRRLWHMVVAYKDLLPFSAIARGEHQVILDVLSVIR